MTRIQLVLDTAMVLLWIATYTIVLISTKAYKYPAISPITQAIIAPFEFAVLFKYIHDGLFGFEYVSIGYLYWSIIEIAIMVLIIKLGHAGKKPFYYILAVAGLTVLMIYLVDYRGQMFFYSYFNTFIGELFWFVFIQRKEYPVKPLNLAAFSTKFIADLISIPVYVHSGPLIIKFICVALPILDMLFIITYIQRKIIKTEPVKQ